MAVLDGGIRTPGRENAAEAERSRIAQGGRRPAMKDEPKGRAKGDRKRSARRKDARKKRKKQATDRRLIGSSPAFRRMETAIREAAKSSLPLLLLGETGTGKELAASATHELSGRKGPFVPLNCATLQGLAASEMFGYERGAFTGASASKSGLFHEANGGTLFFDEVAELSLEAQTMLLRALQERTVRPVGGAKEVRLNVRIIAATNRDLAALVEAGKFREELLYRLRGMVITLPPLRERGSDALAIIRAVLRRISLGRGRKTRARLSREAEAVVLRYPWPGNIRQLELTIEAALGTRGSRVTAGKLIARLEPQVPAGPLSDLRESVLQHVEQGRMSAAELVTVLRASRWRVYQALSDLTSEGLITPVKNGRSVHYERRGPSIEASHPISNLKPSALPDNVGLDTQGAGNLDETGQQNSLPIGVAGSTNSTAFPTDEGADSPDSSTQLDETAHAVMHLVEVRQEIRRKDVEQLGVKYRTAARHLTQLVDMGLLERHGAGSQQFYRKSLPHAHRPNGRAKS